LPPFTAGSALSQTYVPFGWRASEIVIAYGRLTPATFVYHSAKFAGVEMFGYAAPPV
jgi:hypothetical protein